MANKYFIPWDWGYEAILYRTDKVTTPPTSWADLWNPEYSGHLSTIDAGENAYIMAALSLGVDPYHATAEQDAQIKAKLIELKPNLMMYWSDFTELYNLLSSGDIWVAGNAWNETFISLKRENAPVEYVMPEEGAIGYMCGFGIAADTKNLDLAYDYLNSITSAESLAKMSEELAYGPANQAALEFISEETIKALQLDNPDILNQVHFMRPLTEEQHQHFTDLWIEVKSAP